MTGTAVNPFTKPLPVDAGETHHLVCETCHPEGTVRFIALCGYDVTDQSVLDAFPVDRLCLVCRELDFQPCPTCGE